MTTKNTNTRRTYGYCRISTKEQSIERQRTNIKRVYPDAILIEDEYTGTKIEGRRNFEKLIKTVKPGDLIVFDSVSRMSRNAEDGIKLYKDLYSNGVELVFLKEPQINTETYKNAMDKEIQSVETGDQDSDELVNGMINLVTRYIIRLAEKQIKIAFDQAEKEVMDLRERTREGMREVKARNARIIAGIEDGEIKKIGRKTGDKLITKKSVAIKAEIRKYAKEYGGSLTDAQIMKLTGVARNTYYKYKKELINEGT